jgi:hypothetical protein
VPSVSRLFLRLRNRSARELGSRALQAALKRRDATYHALGVAPAAPRITQSVPFVGRFFFDSDEIPLIIEEIRALLPEEAERIVMRARRICRHEFDLLGYSAVDYGNEIDWSRDAVHDRKAPGIAWHRINLFNFAQIGDPKITWELNRHQHLVVLAKAWRLTQDDYFVCEALNQWQSWVEQNPYPIGVNWASSLELAFRSMSWLWMRALLREHPQFTPDTERRMLKLLAIHGAHIRRYLSTYSSPNTHLLGEAVGLMFIGLLCPQIESSGEWSELGWNIVQQQMQNQVRPDGMHFEQSTYYHVYALDFFLHARILAARNGLSVPTEYDQCLRAMLDLLNALCFVGSPPRLGDDDGGRVFDGQRNRAEHLADPLATGAVLFGRGDWKQSCTRIREESLWLFGAEASERFSRLDPQPAVPGDAFPFSGIYRLHDQQSEIILDAGPHGTGRGGHGHADALSVTWRVNGEEVLCDPGTYTYPEEAGRNLLRSTAAHNTLEVDGRSQSDVAGPFAWGRLPHTGVHSQSVGDDFCFVRASHTGYERLEEPVVHTRWILHSRDGWSLVRDTASGSGSHTLKVSWHLGAGIKAGSDPNRGYVALSKGGGSLGVICMAGNPDWQPSLEPAFVSPAYGARETTIVLRFTHQGKLPAEVATVLVPRRVGNDVEFSYDQSASMLDLSVFKFRDSGEETRFIFNDGGRRWRVGNWECNAELFVFKEHDARPVQIFATSISSLSYRGQEIFSGEGTLKLLSWRCGVPAITGVPGASAIARLEAMFAKRREAAGEVRA